MAAGLKNSSAHFMPFTICAPNFQHGNISTSIKKPSFIELANSKDLYLKFSHPLFKLGTADGYERKQEASLDVGGKKLSV